MAKTLQRSILAKREQKRDYRDVHTLHHYRRSTDHLPKTIGHLSTRLKPAKFCHTNVLERKGRSAKPCFAFSPS